MTDDRPDGPHGSPPDGAGVPDPFDGPEWRRQELDSAPPRPRGALNLFRRRRRATGPGRPGRRSASSAGTDDSDDSDVRLRRVRRRRSRYAKRKRRHRFLLGVGVFGLAIVAAVAWLLYTGLQARNELEAVRSQVRQLRTQIAAGDLDAARRTARSLRDHAAEAHDETTGPIWAGAAAVPWLGDPLDSARAITTSVDEVAQSALPALVDASDELDPSKVRGPDGTVDLRAIEAIRPAVADAAAAITRSLDGIRAAPSSTWLGAVDSARGDLLDQVGGLANTVTAANVAAQVLPPMLGADGPRTYMIGFQNEAELRGTGGLPGAFAILRADGGKFRFTKFQSDYTLVRRLDTPFDFGEDYRRLWQGSTAAIDYRDSNVSPNFPYAAQVWSALWKDYSGQTLDGAITLDPTAVSYLLKVTGPARMKGGLLVTSRNVVSLTQNEVYERYGREGNNQRKVFLLDLAEAVSKKLISAKVDSTALARAAAHAVGEHRLLVWSAHEDEEKVLGPTKISGQIPDTAAPYVGLALNNAAANKLDYFLDTDLDVVRSGCGSSRDVTVTIRVHNGAPTDLTDYVYGKQDISDLPKATGSNLTLVSYYATRGAQLTSVTRDGKPTAIGSGFERGHPVFTYRLGLEPGRTSTLVLHLTEHDDGSPLVVRPQPMVRPVQVDVRNECSD